MIADLHFDPKYQFDIEPNVVLAHKDDNVSIYLCSDRNPVNEVDINDFIPENRCYRIGGRDQKSTIKVKYSTRILKLISDTIWIVPTSSGAVYELMLLGPLFGRHDFFSNASTNERCSLHLFRLQNPGLDYIFDLEVMRSFVKTMPVLGGSVAPAKMPEAFNSWKSQWQTDLTDKFTSARYCDYIAMLFHTSAINILYLPDKINDQRWNLVSYVIADELRLNGSEFVGQIVNRLTVDIIDIHTERSYVIRSAVAEWVHQSSATRILDKMNGALPESSAYYMNVVANYISEVIIKDLDSSLLNTVRQYHEE